MKYWGSDLPRSLYHLMNSIPGEIEENLEVICLLQHLQLLSQWPAGFERHDELATSQSRENFNMIQTSKEIDIEK